MKSTFLYFFLNNYKCFICKWFYCYTVSLNAKKVLQMTIFSPFYLYLINNYHWFVLTVV